MKPGFVLAAAVAAILLLATPTDLTSCGPFVPEVVFVPPHGPVDPNSEFARGKLGVILPGFRTGYMVIAYRYLGGLRTEPDEAKALVPPARQYVDYSLAKPEDMDPLSRWVATRNRIAGSKGGWISPYKSFMNKNEYVSFQNCLDDAFDTATKTLQARVSAWGAGSAAVNDWIAGQDAVFSNCSEKAGPTPPPAPANSPAWLQADRAYQVAAAAFYAGDWNTARKGFEQIALDKSSPWSRYARYLIARTYIREGTLEKNPDALNTAHAQLIAIGQPGARLLQFVDTRMALEATFLKLSDELAGPKIGPDAIADFLLLYQNAKVRTGRDLLDWLSIWNDTTAGAKVDAIAKWRDGGGTRWLLPALYRAGSQEPDVPEMLRAAHSVGPESPGYLSIAYYAASLHVKLGQLQEAREWDEKVLATQLATSDRNLFLAQRLSLARDWAEFLKFSPREVKFYSLDDSTTEELGKAKLNGDWVKYANLGPAFDSDSAEVWNRQIPLSLWIDAAKGTILPRNLRLEIARSGWVRALVLNKPAEAKVLLTLWEQLDRTGAAVADSYKSAPDAESERLAAAVILARNPGLDPLVRSGFGRLSAMNTRDELRDDWWCSLPALPAQTAAAFLRDPDREEGIRESAFLNDAARSGANYVTAEAIHFAETRPDDPSAPELLARAVEATHFNPCSNSATGGLSQRAFNLLKQRYPNTTWAQDTKYWYK